MQSILWTSLWKELIILLDILVFFFSFCQFKQLITNIIIEHLLLILSLMTNDSTKSVHKFPINCTFWPQELKDVNGTDYWHWPYDTQLIFIEQSVLPRELHVNIYHTNTREPVMCSTCGISTRVYCEVCWCAECVHESLTVKKLRSLTFFNTVLDDVKAVDFWTGSSGFWLDHLISSPGLTPLVFQPGSPVW